MYLVEHQFSIEWVCQYFLSKNYYRQGAAVVRDRFIDDTMISESNVKMRNLHRDYHFLKNAQKFDTILIGLQN